MASYEEWLMHTGVMGMKWGKRKVTARPRPKKKLSKREMQKRQEEKRNKEIHSMSQEEMAKKVDRLRLEKTFRELTASDIKKNQYFDGKKFVAKVLNNAGEKVATQLVTAAMTKAVNNMLGKEIIQTQKDKK